MRESWNRSVERYVEFGRLTFGFQRPYAIRTPTHKKYSAVLKKKKIENVSIESNRKSGIPAAVDTPAPVWTTIRWHSFINSTNCSILQSSVDESSTIYVKKKQLNFWLSIIFLKRSKNFGLLRVNRIFLYCRIAKDQRHNWQTFLSIKK